MGFRVLFLKGILTGFLIFFCVDLCAKNNPPTGKIQKAAENLKMNLQEFLRRRGASIRQGRPSRMDEKATGYIINSKGPQDLYKHLEKLPPERIDKTFLEMTPLFKDIKEVIKIFIGFNANFAHRNKQGRNILAEMIRNRNVPIENIYWLFDALRGDIQVHRAGSSVTGISEEVRRVFVSDAMNNGWIRRESSHFDELLSSVKKGELDAFIESEKERIQKATTEELTDEQVAKIESNSTKDFLVSNIEDGSVSLEIVMRVYDQIQKDESVRRKAVSYGILEGILTRTKYEHLFNKLSKEDIVEIISEKQEVAGHKLSSKQKEAALKKENSWSIVRNFSELTVKELMIEAILRRDLEVTEVDTLFDSMMTFRDQFSRRVSVRRLMENENYDLPDNNGNTLLVHAVVNRPGDRNLFRQLAIDLKCDPNAKDKKGNNLLLRSIIKHIRYPEPFFRILLIGGTKNLYFTLEDANFIYEKFDSLGLKDKEVAMALWELIKTNLSQHVGATLSSQRFGSRIVKLMKQSIIQGEEPDPPITIRRIQEEENASLEAQADKVAIDRVREEQRLAREREVARRAVEENRKNLLLQQIADAKVGESVRIGGVPLPEFKEEPHKTEESSVVVHAGKRPDVDERAVPEGQGSKTEEVAEKSTPVETEHKGEEPTPSKEEETVSVGEKSDPSTNEVRTSPTEESKSTTPPPVAKAEEKPEQEALPEGAEKIAEEKRASEDEKVAEENRDAEDAARNAGHEDAVKEEHERAIKDSQAVQKLTEGGAPETPKPEEKRAESTNGKDKKTASSNGKSKPSNNNGRKKAAKPSKKKKPKPSAKKVAKEDGEGEGGSGGSKKSKTAPES